ncbi:MAG: VCBS repeat-containing protein [Planctomycetes bacterium]|nr:VCBS repeat-containing protein [Planctomycetota bacterium]
MLIQNFRLAGFVAAVAMICGCQPERTAIDVPKNELDLQGTSKSDLPSALNRKAKAKAPESTDEPSADHSKGWFSDISAESGIDFVHFSGDEFEKPFPSSNGSGVGAIDFDRDGMCDLYFATGCEFPVDESTATPHNRIYRNLGGGHFSDVSGLARADTRGFSAGVAVGDFDSDGFPDVYVSRYGQDLLLRNQGDGTFERIEKQAEMQENRWGTSAAFLDYDSDGLLDIYVCNYSDWTWETRIYCGDQVRKVRMHCGPTSVAGEASLLWHNEGDGTFTNRLDEAGLAQRICRGQGVVAADINRDGYTDLYVTNDLHPNFLFFNNGDGTFRDLTESSGAAYDAFGTSQAGMGVDAADINGDGRIDLFVTNFSMEYNTIYINTQEKFFQDLTSRFGTAAASLPWIGWGTAFIDFDLDGRLDLVVTNGHVDNNRADEPYEHSPLLYRGVKGKFESIGGKGGSYFRAAHTGRGLAVADLDHDGDLDLVITHQDQRPAVLLNNRIPDNGSRTDAVAVRLIGRQSNRDAIGATVVAEIGQRKLTQPVKGGSSYSSSSERKLVFAVLPGETEVKLSIRWPGGRQSEVAGLQTGGDYVIVEPDLVDSR